ncbi:MAG: methyltransferase domain-containing protein, partial [Caulobacteraceae bacterium]
FVLEHVDDVPAFAREVDRLLKPGGVFCARTPHRLHYVTLAARLVGNARHRSWLRAIQPDRPSESVFPTRYRLSTFAQVRRAFKGWSDHSYYYPSEPQYYFGTRWGFRLFSILHRLAPRPLTGNLFIFLRKPAL